MLDLLTQPDMRPFSIMAAFVLGLVVLEIVLMLLGLNTQIGDPDVDASLDVDADLGADALEALDSIEAMEGIDINSLEPLHPTAETEAQSSFLSAIGLNKVPSALWLAGLLSFLAIGGFVVQGLVNSLSFGLLPYQLVLAGVALPALWMTKRYASFVGRLIPSVETTAISKTAYHRRRGRVVSGTAMVGKPAEVQWQDGYGNFHYLLAEPLDSKDTIHPETEVLILRTRNREARLIALS